MKRKEEPSEATKANLKLNSQFNQEEGKNMDTAPFVYNQSVSASSEMNRVLKKENERRKDEEKPE